MLCAFCWCSWCSVQGRTPSCSDLLDRLSFEKQHGIQLYLKKREEYYLPTARRMMKEYICIWLVDEIRLLTVTSRMHHEKAGDPSVGTGFCTFSGRPTMKVNEHLFVHLFVSFARSIINNVQTVQIVVHFAIFSYMNIFYLLPYLYRTFLFFLSNVSVGIFTLVQAEWSDFWYMTVHLLLLG